MSKQHFMVFACCALLAGCATAPVGSVIGSQSWYGERILEINQAFAAGELTREEQLTLKNEADTLRLMYQRDMDERIDRNMRWNSALHNHPVYNCASGVCTPIYP